MAASSSGGRNEKHVDGTPPTLDLTLRVGVDDRLAGRARCGARHAARWPTVVKRAAGAAEGTR
jgi:hypothetical protein